MVPRPNAGERTGYFLSRKNYNGFEEAEKMIKNGSMISISDYKEFKNTIDSIISDRNIRQEMSKKCTKYFNQNKGAVKLILAHLH